MTFAERKAALKQAGTCQAAIARRTGYSTVYVHEVLKGTRDNRAIQRAVARVVRRPLAEVFPKQGLRPQAA